MNPHKRRVLEELATELARLQASAKGIDDAFLAYLIETAAGEARDELRDGTLGRRSTWRTVPRPKLRVVAKEQTP